MLNQENDIIQVINSYTDQIERYENMSTWFSAFCIVCVLVVLILASVLMMRQKKDEADKRELYSIFLSGLFLIVPSIITLYLYTFAMNMRKVALYRGYLGFLESRYNDMTQTSIMLFDDKIINTFFSFRAFLVNGLGPAIMIIFIVISFLIGFGIPIYLVRKMQHSKVRDGLKLLICILLIVCIFFDGLCCYYLSINDRVVDSVVNYCEDQGGVFD